MIGSGTGEETYTLAILLAEWYEQKGLPHRVKIFASDVHAESLALPPKAVYTADALRHLKSDRVEKFFIERPDGYHVVPELRKMVVFNAAQLFARSALHAHGLGLLPASDEPPFGTCGGQRPLADSFCSARWWCTDRSPGLRLGDMSQEFEAIETEQGIYRKSRLVCLGRTTTIPKSGREQYINRQPLESRTLHRDLIELYDKMLEQHVPDGWLISEDGTLLHTFQNAGKYIETRGRTKSDLVSMVREELRGPLMLMIRKVTETRQPLDINHWPIVVVTAKSSTAWRAARGSQWSLRHPGQAIFPVDSMPGNRLTSNWHTIRWPPTTEPQERDSQASGLQASGLQASGLQASGPGIASPAATRAIDFCAAQSSNITDLERELELTRENLQLTIQDLRLANEELKEINEEVTCANEELQSANEELHSVNEELHTVNAEHQRKIDELTALNDDMDNLLTNSNVHTLFLSRDLRLRLFTPRIVDLFNLIPQDIGRHIATFNHNLLDISLAIEAERVLKEDRAIRREVQSNEGNWFVLRISPYLSRGNVEGLVITLVDVTSQKNSQNALLRSEQRFELAVQGSSEGIWDWPNVNQEKIWCSPRLYSILGYNEQDLELTHSGWIEMIHPDDRAEFERLLQSGGPFNFECRIERSDQSYRWVRICGASHRDSVGRPVRMAGSLEDVTERRIAQDEVKMAVRLRDRFLAMLSHELRNPLSAVLNAIQLFEEREHDRDRAMNVIRRQSQQMARLLDDLLDVSRISNNKFELIQQPLDYNEIIDSAMQALQGYAHERGQHLVFERPDVSVHSVGDAQRLEQVMVNLLNNAIKYSMPGGQISVHLHKRDNKVLISVSDSGVGLSEDMKSRVFDLFVQSEATLDRADGGMGVGLTLVKAIVEMHGGRVRAESEGLNKGCQFIVELPCHAPVASLVSAHSIAPAQGLKVVIVEDMDDSREMLAELLTLKGHQVEVASEGDEGLALIQRTIPDIALVDIGLPKRNGFEIARELRATGTYDHVKLVALTGYGQASDRQQVKEAGFDEHIVKPLKPHELMQVLATRKVITT